VAPDTVFLVDAVEAGEPTGTVLLMDAEEVDPGTGWNVHRTPLALLMQYLTGARVFMLGIQAGCTDLGAPLSPAVRQATSAVVRDLLRIRP